MTQIRMRIPKFEDKTKEKNIENNKNKKEKLIETYISSKQNSKDVNSSSVLTVDYDNGTIQSFEEDKLWKENYLKQKKENERIQNEKKQLLSLLSKTNKDLKSYKSKNHILKNEINELKEVVITSKNKNQDIDELKFKINQLEDFIIEYRKEINKLERKNTELERKTQIDPDKVDYYQFTTISKPYADQLKNFQSKYDKLRSSYKDLELDKNSLNNSIEYLKKELNISRINLTEKQDELNNVRLILRYILYMFLHLKSNNTVFLADEIEEFKDKFIDMKYGIVHYEKDVDDNIFIDSEGKGYKVVNLGKQIICNKITVSAYIDYDDYAHIIGQYEL